MIALLLWLMVVQSITFIAIIIGFQAQSSRTSHIKDKLKDIKNNLVGIDKNLLDIYKRLEK